MSSNEDFDYAKLSSRSTGSQEVPEDYKLVVFPLGKYVIIVKLRPNNEFIGIEEVKINKDFLSYEQKTPPKGFHDVDEFYRE